VRNSLIIHILLLIAGLVIGSFLNMLIFRLPRSGYTPLRPRRSICPDCSHELAWNDNIPVFSYILLRARCRYCKKPIPLRYFIVELLTAGSFLLNSIVMRPYLAIAACLISSGLILVSFIDLEHFLIPDSGIAVIAAGSLAWSILSGTFPRILIEAAIVFGMMILFFFLANRFKKDSFGFGDVELLGVLALATGVIGTLFTIMIGSIVALAAYAIVSRAQGKKLSKETRIPFGPFLALGGYISLLLLPLLKNLYGL